MTSMNISLPDDLKDFVDQYIQGRYSTASEFIRELIRNAQKEVAREQLEKLLLEGLDSGESIEITPEFWDERRAELQRRLKQRNKKRLD